MKLAAGPEGSRPTDVIRPLRRLFGGGRRQEAEKPLRAELLSIERLEERARALAASFTLARNPRRKARPFFARLEDNARVLREAYRVLADDVHRGEFVPAGRGMAARQLPPDRRRDPGCPARPSAGVLPASCPSWRSREMAGIARVYAMALELIRHTDGRLDRTPARALRGRLPDGGPPDDRRAVGLAQHAQARPHREPAAAGRRNPAGPRGAARGRPRIWPRSPAREAAPLAPLPEVLETAYVVRLLQRMREYGPLVSPVRAAVEERLAAQRHDGRGCDPHRAPDARPRPRSPWPTPSPACGSAPRLDWTQYFENVSLIEQVLQRDPAGVYGRMDFLSRDRYRQAVEELAEPTGEAQLRVALRSVESARQAAELKSIRRSRRARRATT